MRGVEDIERDEACGENWRLILGDSCEELQKMEPNSIGYSIFSPPFASLYTYSDSPRDLGNCQDDGTFHEHFKFICEGLFRVMQPGRLVSMHCMDMPTSKAHHGHIGLRDFPGELTRAMESAGFIYHSKVTIWKDPVIAMQRTKALGLLYKQILKDSSMSRQGIPDEMRTFRKPGDNAHRIAHVPNEFPLAEDKCPEGWDKRFNWQNFASPVWMDINPSKTLQARSARDERDERHICPLQLDVIERGIALWSNKGDVVLSPFAGIGSEGHIAVSMDRKFIGCELKRSYYEQAKKNLTAVETEINKKCLFGDVPHA